MPVKEIESFDEFRKIINSDKVSAIDFWAEWCMPCKMMTPLFNKLAELEEYKNIEFYSCDTEAHESVMMECNIKSMPSFLAFKSGNKIAESVGALPQNLQAMLKTAAAAATATTDAPASSSSEEVKTDVPAPTATTTAPLAAPAAAPTATPTLHASPNIQEIKSMEHYNQIINSDKVSVIDYWADWCAPCKMMTPIFKKFAALEEFKGVDFYTCDVEEQEDVMYLAVVKSMPSFMGYHSGKKIGEAIGTYPEKLQALLKLAAKVAKEGPSAIPAPAEPEKPADKPSDAPLAL